MIFLQKQKKSNIPLKHLKTFNHEKNICALFYENSTRTKLSFQKACSNINAVFHNLDIQTSSVNKGETFTTQLKQLIVLEWILLLLDIHPLVRLIF